MHDASIIPAFGCEPSAVCRGARLPLLVAVLAAVGALPPGLSAQDGFLFSRPEVRLGLHAGYAVPRAESEIFDFTSDRLTVDEDDFRSYAVGGAFAYRATERLDVSFEIGYAAAETRSEFRNWVDAEDRPIEQTTRFSRRPVTLSVRAYLRERGRRAGRFAWVPTGWSPYVGAGGGAVSYEFAQEGDFVDFGTEEIFTERFRSSGTTPIFHVLAGTDVSLGSRFVLAGEGRYSWASAEMSRDFVDFDEIDLSGFQFTAGLWIRW